MSKPAQKSVVSVHVDIARLTLEVSRLYTDAQASAWIRSLVQSLALRDKTVNEYGAYLLEEAENYMAEIAEKRRIAANARWHPNNTKRIEKVSTSIDLHQKDMQLHQKGMQKDANDAVHYRAEQSITEEEQEKTPLPPTGGDAQIQKPTEQFEAARKLYPGTKNGFRTEWENFKRKAGKNFHLTASLLLPAIERELVDRQDRISRGGFVPEFAHFRTWINQRRWEQEFSKEVSNGNNRSHHGESRNEKLGRDARALREKIREAAGAH
jgi:hypothetical protein